MAFRNLKEFQKRLANSAMSRYAEAILAISAVAQSIVSHVGRTIQQYASVRNSIQLVTTNADDEFVDETTEDREVIADSVFVQAWQNIATAVERLISLRRDLASEGVVTEISNYPSKVRSLKTITSLPVITPRVGSPDLTNGGYIYLPTDHLNNSTSEVKRVRLSPIPFSGKFNGVSFELLSNRTLNFTKGEQYSLDESSHWTNDSYPELGSSQCLIAAVLNVAKNSTADNPSVGAVGVVRFDGSILSFGAMSLYGISFGSTIDGMTQISFTSASYSDSGPGGALSGNYTVWPKTTDKELVTQRLVVTTDAPSPDEVTVDPLDPYSVFSQAYDAADVLVELLDDIGYPTALTASDKQMLKERL